MAQRVTIQIVADASQAQGVVDAINKSLGNIGGNAFKAVTQDVNKLSDSMLKAVQISNQFVQAGYRLTVGLSAPIIAAAAYVTKLGGELESARASFEVFTGSIVKATQHLEDLKQLALSSPLDFNQILSLSRYLQAAGIEAQKVIPLLKSVGNALIVSGSPETIERIVQQLVRIQNLGRVTLRELNPLARAGIPVFAELADAIRRPGEEADKTSLRLKNLLKSGNLPGPEFLNYFQAIQKVRFPEGLEKAGDTLKGQFQELKNAVTIAAGNLGEALAPAALLIIRVLTEVTKIVNSVILTFHQLPAGIRILVGLFIGLLAVVGPLILAFGYVSRAILSSINLFQLATGAITKNTVVSTENAIASNAVASAKTKEAAATELVAKAVQNENKAKVAQLTGNDSSLARQLPLIFSDPRRNSKGRFTSAPPPLPYSAPRQLGLFDNLQTADSQLIGKGAADDAIAGAAVTSRLSALGTSLIRFAGFAGIAVVAAKGIYDAFKAFGDLAPDLKDLNTELDSIGFSFNDISKIVSNSVSAIIDNIDKLGSSILGTKDGAVSKTISGIGDAFLVSINPASIFSFTIRKVDEDVKQLTKDIEDYKNKHPDFNLTKEIATSRPLYEFFGPAAGLVKAGAQRSIDQDAKDAAVKNTATAAQRAQDQANADASAVALRNKIKLNEQEQEYAKLLQLTQDGQRQSREFALVAEGRELGGLQLINKELDKYIDKLQTRIEKIPGSDLTQEITRPLSAVEQSNVFRAVVADNEAYLKKTQKEVADAATKADQESYKVRIAALDAYTKDRVSRLQSLNASEILSTLQVTRQSAAIESSAARDRFGLEVSNLRDSLQHELAEIDKVRTSLNTPGSDAELRQRAKILTAGNPNVTADQVNQVQIKLKKEALTQIDALEYIAAVNTNNKILGLKNALASEEYNIEKNRIDKENQLFKDANNAHIAASAQAAISAAEFEKSTIEQRRQVQLQSLQFTQPVGISQILAVKNQELAINVNSINQVTTAELRALAIRNSEETRLVTEAAKNKYANQVDGQELIDRELNDLSIKQYADVQQIASKAYDEIGNAQRASALEQFNAIKEHALTIFDSIKGASKGVLDQLFDRSRAKSFGQILGDTIKGAFKNVATDFLSNQLSAAGTRLITGQNVALKSTVSGPLGLLFGSKPVIGNGGPPSTVGGVNPETAAQLSAIYSQAYTAAASTQPKRLDIPEAPVADVLQKVPPLLQQLADKFGAEGILGVKPIGNSIPVVITGFESAAKNEAAAFQKAIKEDKIPDSLKDTDEGRDLQKYFDAKNLPKTLQSPIYGNTASVSSLFGTRDDPRAGHKGQTEFHKGVDFAAPLGTPVLASLGGTVTKVNEQFNELGNSIRVLNSDTGIETLYGHLIKKPDLQTGQTVEQGGVLGNVGATGAVTGPHLHFGTYTKDVAVDPRTLPNALGLPVLPPTVATAPEASLTNIANAIVGKIDDIAKTTMVKVDELTRGAPSAYTRYTRTPIYNAPKKEGIEAEYLEDFNKILLYNNKPDDPNTQRTILHEETHALLTKKYDDVNKYIPEKQYAIGNDILQGDYPSIYPDEAHSKKELIPFIASGESNRVGLTPEQGSDVMNKVITGLRSTGISDDTKIADILQKIADNGSKLLDKTATLAGSGSALFAPRRDYSSLYGGTPKASAIEDTAVDNAVAVGNLSFPYLNANSDTVASAGTGITAISTSPTDTLGASAASPATTGGGFNLASALPAAVAGTTGGIVLGSAIGAAAGVASHFTEASKVQRAIKDAYGVNVDPKYAQSIYDNVISQGKYGGNIQAALRSPELLSMVSAYSASGQGKSGIGTATKSFITNGGALATGAAALPLAGQIFGGGNTNNTTTPPFINSASSSGFNTSTLSQLPSLVPGLGVNPNVASTTNKLFRQFAQTSSVQNQQQQAANRAAVSNQGFTKTLKNFLTTGKFLKSDTTAQDLSTLPDAIGRPESIASQFPNLNGTIFPSDTSSLPFGIPSSISLDGSISPSDINSLPLGIPSSIALDGGLSAGDISALPLGVPSSISLQTGSGEGGIEGGNLPAGIIQNGDDVANAATGLSGVIGSANGALGKFAGNSAISGLATGVGLGLFSAGLSQKSGTGVGSAVLSTTGGASTGFGLSKSLGLNPLTGIGVGAGVGLFSAGVKRGGAIGVAEDVGGGALAGASLGAQFGGPVGAAAGAVIGAAAGAITGVARLFIKGAAEKVQSEVKTLYNITISKQYAQSIYDTIIKPKYGGNVQAGIRSKDVLDMLALYSSSTGQKFGIANVARPLQLIQTGTGLTQAANYQNNQALSFANLGVYGGVPTQTILTPQHLSTGGIAAYQQLPGQGDSAVFNLNPNNASSLPSPASPGASNAPTGSPASSPASIIVENKLPSDQVGSYFDGRTVRTISNNPSAVSSSASAAYNSNVNRRGTAGQLINPNELAY